MTVLRMMKRKSLIKFLLDAGVVSPDTPVDLPPEFEILLDDVERFVEIEKDFPYDNLERMVLKYGDAGLYFDVHDLVEDILAWGTVMNTAKEVVVSASLERTPIAELLHSLVEEHANSEVDHLSKSRLRRLNARQLKKMQKRGVARIDDFAVSRLQTASEYFAAGFLVSQKKSSGAAPILGFLL